jgi:hypothetical protein
MAWTNRPGHNYIISFQEGKSAWQKEAAGAVWLKVKEKK